MKACLTICDKSEVVGGEGDDDKVAVGVGGQR
jgi:hypothetical protein